MTASRTLTLDQLKAAGTCQEDTDLFTSLFGDSVEVTEALARTHAKEFNWGWASESLLSDSAQAAYNAAKAQAREDYNAAWANAEAVYEAAIAPERAAYNAAIAPAWAIYHAAIAPARAALDTANAGAWARAYINDAGA